MLILVGVSITIAIKGGLFDTTKKVAKGTEEAKNAEQELANGRVKIGETWYNSIEDYVNEKPSANQEEGGEENLPKDSDTDTSAYDNAPKDANGLLLANVQYKTDGKTAVIPKGFKIVEETNPIANAKYTRNRKIEIELKAFKEIDGIGGTRSIADGLVVQDEDGNEFVWIPVEVTESDTETSIASFYRSEWENNARVAELDSNYTEPYASGYEGEAEEYTEMVKSVYKNKGFYIGRYEAGSLKERDGYGDGTTEMVVKKNQFPYNSVGWGASKSDYTSDVEDDGDNQGKGAVRLSKEMYQSKNVGVISTLCYGVQWDAMLDFIKDDNHNVTNSISWGNHYRDEGCEIATTGSSDDYVVKNIYDIAGNVREWTLEDGATFYRVTRGGDYMNDGATYHAASREKDVPNLCYQNIGFRVALYIK